MSMRIIQQSSYFIWTFDWKILFNKDVLVSRIEITIENFYCMGIGYFIFSSKSFKIYIPTYVDTKAIAQTNDTNINLKKKVFKYLFNNES